MTTLAGQHLSAGTADGTGAAARFAGALGIAIDRRGLLYVADGNDRIRVVTPAGVVTTLVGDAAPDWRQGNDLGQVPYFATNVAVDLAGNLYISDAGNHTVRKAVSTTRLVNLAVRSRAGTADQVLTMGFGVAGSGAERVLVRAVGLTLAQLGILNGVADPVLKLIDATGRQLQQNDDWDGTDQTSQLFTSVGAFPLEAGSKDSAIDTTLVSQVATAQVASKDAASGIALLEVYDAGAGTAGQLTNASVRTATGGGQNALITGFVLKGTAPKTVLVRAAGPSLVRFGLAYTSVLADPRLTLFDGSVTLGENDNWGGSADLKAAFRRVGAFDFDADTSKDSALLVTLNPGAYTVLVTGADATNAVALVEVYVLQ